MDEPGGERLAQRREPERSDSPGLLGAQHFAVTWHQANLCENMIARTACRSAWTMFTIGHAVRIKPAADRRRLERAFKVIQQKHEVLRANFVQVRGMWRAVVHPDARAKVQISEHGPKDDQDQQADLKQHVGVGFAPEEPPVSLHLMRYAGEGDVVLLQVSHLVTDAFGSSLIFRDFLNALVGVPMGADPLSYKDFEQVYVRQPKELLESGLTYWNTLLNPPPSPVQIGLAKSDAHNVNRYANDRRYDEFTQVISQKDSKRLKKRARSIGCSPFALLCSSFYHAVHSVCGAEALDFGTLMGRNDARLERWSGMAITNLPAIIRQSDGANFTDRTRSLHHQLQASMQHLPHPAVQPQHDVMRGYTELGGTAGRFRIRIPDYKPRASLTSILSPMLGSDKHVQIGRYQVEYLSVSTLTSMSELMLSQSLRGNRMHIPFVYDADAFSEKEIRNLASLTASAMLDS